MTHPLRAIGNGRGGTSIGVAVIALLWCASTPLAADATTHIPATTYSSNTTWTQAASPYILDGSVTVSSGATLTIEPGVVVKLNGQSRQISVAGVISAQGTATAPIVFTSYKDDSIGGDSNGDGPSQGQRGDWHGIIGVNSGTVTLQNTELRYGGSGSATSYGEVEVQNSATATLTGSWIHDSQYSAVVVRSAGSKATLTDSILEQNGKDGVYTNAGTLELHGGVVRQNGLDGVFFNFSSRPSLQSILVNADLTQNSRYGVNLQTGSSITAGDVPRLNLNNVYANGSGSFPNQAYFITQSDIRGADWRDNYWGSDVTYRVNEQVCRSVGKNSVGYLAYPSDPGTQYVPPKGPLDRSYYLADNIVGPACGYDQIRIDADEYSSHPIDHASTFLSFRELYGLCGTGGLMVTPHENRPVGCISDPAASSTGNLAGQVTDLRMGGAGVRFALVRTYNSLDTRSGALGTGWRHNYETSLDVKPSGDVVFTGEGGEKITYRHHPDGFFAADPNVLSKLRQTPSGYELTRRDQVVYSFDQQGRLQTLRDRNGLGLSFAYDAQGRLSQVTDTGGRHADFAYDGSGHLVSVTLPDGRQVSYTYSNGFLASATDARGKTTTYTYDKYGLLQKEVDPEGHTAFENTYSPSGGRLTSQKDGEDNTTTFSWDNSTQTATATDARGNAWRDVYQNGLLAKRIDPLGDTWRYDYDSALNLTKLTDPRDNATTMTYDGAGNLLTRTAPSPLPDSEAFTYDQKNDLTSYTDGRGNYTTLVYDPSGNLTQLTRPGGVTTTITRDPQTGLATKLTDPRGDDWSLAYDADRNLAAVTTPSGDETSFGRDQTGRLTSVVDPRGNAPGADPNAYRWLVGWNADDQPSSLTDPLGDQTSLAYDGAGNPTNLTDAENHATSYAYDRDNRLTKVTAQDGTHTDYAYDPIGNLTSRTDPLGHTTSLTYDQANLLTQLDAPEGKRWTAAYDPAGNLTRLSDANGNATPAEGDGQTAYSYDALDRLTGIDYSDATPDVSLAYDAAGNPAQMTDGAGTEAYAHDALNRLTQVARGTDAFAYAYDPASNLVSRTYPGGQLTSYSYDPSNRIASATVQGDILSAPSATTNFAYDPAGRLTQIANPNGVTETRGYDRSGRVTDIRAEHGPDLIARSSYAYDRVGNPLQVTRADRTETYSYDPLSRVSEVCYAESCAGAQDFVRYAYDAAGNRTREERPSGATTYSYDAADELLSQAGPSGTTSYAYDRNGNETQAGGRTFAYDLANRLIRTTQGQDTTTYSYDGHGNRLTADRGSQPTSTQYRWDENAPNALLAEERDGLGAPIRSYLYANGPLGMSTQGQRFTYHRDALGSILAVTNEAGQGQLSYDYEPFGQDQQQRLDPAAPENPIRFAGELRDPEAGLYDLRAREYDPQAGRFLQTDPLPSRIAAPYVSTYVYTRNRSTVLVDPSGMGSVWPPSYPTHGSGKPGCQDYLGFLCGIPGIVGGALPDSSDRNVVVCNSTGYAVGEATGDVLTPIAGPFARPIGFLGGLSFELGCDKGAGQ
jgi:RHS repeat-associated protein